MSDITPNPLNQASPTASLFDIVGPVMVGPSSSHTAGAVRLGLMARALADKPIIKAQLTLYNSFAQTYRGHGTDKGLIAGLLGLNVDDERIKEAPDLLAKSPLTVEFICFDKPNTLSPNTVRFDLTLEDGQTLSLVGHSVGGGNIYISQVNGFSVSLQGELPTLLLLYSDQPGMIWQTTKVIAEAGINIATLQCNRQSRGETAFMTITLDHPLPPEAEAGLYTIANVHFCRHLEALPR